MKRTFFLLGLSSVVACGQTTITDLNTRDVGSTSDRDAGSVTGRDAGETELDGGAEIRDAGDVRDGGPVRDSGPMNTGPLANWCTGQPAEFSFFVTSMNALWALSGDQIDDWTGGLGGDLGGLTGADSICQQIGDATGHGNRTWRAFLSVTDDGNGNSVDAIDRIGTGPWVDANGRTVATGLAGLAGVRPDGDVQSVVDLPDECGVPLSALGDAHDILTGSNTQGRLNSMDPESTCLDWTSTSGNIGRRVMCGHAFPREGDPRRGQNWVSDHPIRGCGRGANLLNNGPGSGTCVGCGGGYGGLYCFAE